MNSETRRLQKALGYEYRDPVLLKVALSHRSYAPDNNERLEFLGDSVLNFVIAEALYERFPEAREGQLSRLRARLVKGATLAELGREFQLGDCLLLGSGEMKSGGHRRDSIIADAVEALIGAMLLDSSLDECRVRIREWFASRLDKLSLKDTQKDAKTRLQEYLQARQMALPVYDVLKVEGEAHAQTFHVECQVVALATPTRGTGGSRRLAEQEAAAAAMVQLEAGG